MFGLSLCEVEVIGCGLSLLFWRGRVSSSRVVRLQSFAESLLQLAGIGCYGGKVARIPWQRFCFHWNDHAKLDHLIKLDFRCARLLFRHCYFVRICACKRRRETFVFSVTRLARRAVRAELLILEKRLALFD